MPQPAASFAEFVRVPARIGWLSFGGPAGLKWGVLPVLALCAAGGLALQLAAG